MDRAAQANRQAMAQTLDLLTKFFPGSTVEETEESIVITIRKVKGEHDGQTQLSV